MSALERGNRDVSNNFLANVLSVAHRCVRYMYFKKKDEKKFSACNFNTRFLTCHKTDINNVFLAISREDYFLIRITSKRLVQHGGVEGRALTPSCENTSITKTAEQSRTGRHRNSPEKIPHI